MGRWPKTAAEWKKVIDEESALTERERQALTIEHVEWPAGATNLAYMTQREMAAKMGISLVTLRYYLHRAWYKLGLHPFPPRGKVPVATRRAVLEAVKEDSLCDLCQRPIGRIRMPPSESISVDLLEPARFVESVSIDHILPVSQGGTHAVENLRVVHAFCNKSDGARVPIEQRAPPPFGYVRRHEILPNGRGPRTWIEVDERAAAVVRLLMSEYATGHQSIASLCRMLKRGARRFGRRTIAPLLNGGAQVQAAEVRYVIEYHARTRTDRELWAGYVALVPADTAAASGRQLARRWDRIRRARETRELRLSERREPKLSAGRGRRTTP